MTGIDARTGKALSGIAHVRQSARDILLTPIGSRVLLREYGSRLIDLVDRPLASGLLADIQAEAADALGRWEPRLRVRSVRARATGGAAFELDIEGDYLPDGESIQLEGIRLAERQGGAV